MKIRDGFVSNSSSSSFVVRVRASEYDVICQDPFKVKRKAGDMLITDEQLEALKAFRFEFALDTLHASQVEMGMKPKKASVKRATMAHLSVHCNESEVVEFLVKNRIPFEGVGHYGHYSIFLRPDQDKVYVAENMGLMYEMYGTAIPWTDQRSAKLRSQSVKDIDEKGLTIR